MKPTRRVLVTIATVVVLLVAGVGLWQAGHDRPRTLEQRTDALAAELRCPTCQAQSLAMSRSEIAAAMRAEIRAQLVAGRSPEQIRAWFADRYGPVVLLEPPRTGVGLSLWLVPVALLGIGLILTVGAVRRRTTTSPAGTSPAGAPPGAGSPALKVSAPARLVLPAAALAVVAAGVATWLVLGGTGPHDAEPATGARLSPELASQDVRTQVRLGLTFLQADEPEQAESVARQILSGHPEHPEGLLVLGLAQRARDLPAARETLQRFLDLAPDHPAASEVRRLLADS